MQEAFVYCWTDKTTNKLYVGSHKGSINDGYICSSKVVKKEYKIRPKDFSRQIIAEGSLVEMRILEAKILQSVDAAKDPMFYNLHNNNGKYINQGISESTKKKISRTRLKKQIKHSEESKKLMGHSGSKNYWYGSSRTGELNPMFGKHHSEETLIKMRKPKKSVNYGKLRIGTSLYTDGKIRKYFTPDKVPYGWGRANYKK